MRTALGQGAGGHGQDHELLDVDRIVGMRAAVDDVHHRHRQGARRGPADVAVERLAMRLGRRLGDGEADREDRVGAEPRLVGRAVQLDHEAVDLHLVGGLEPADRVEDLAVPHSTAFNTPLPP
jgi:hypothetical protein